jgi:hypothetical protein
MEESAMIGGGFIGLAKRMDAWLIDEQNRARHARKRVLDPDDVDGFFAAADNRTGPVSNVKLIAMMDKVSHYRMWRLRNDMHWLRKQLAKRGIDPERARDIV